MRFRQFLGGSLVAAAMALGGMIDGGWAYDSFGVRPAIGGSGANQTTFTNSTKTNYHSNDTLTGNVVSYQYATTVLGVVEAAAGNQAVVFNQTVTGSPALQEVRDALDLARASVVNSSVASQIQPASLVNSSVAHSNNTVTNTQVIAANVSTATNVYVGPQTIMVGPEQSQTLVLAAGAVNYDSLTTSDIYQNRTIFANVSTVKTSTMMVVGKVQP